MRSFFAVLIHAVVLLAAAWWSDSVGEFLVTGLGPALLLDRLALRLLPWRVPTNRVRAGVRRLFVFALGAGVVYCSRPGVIPFREAVTYGAALSLLTFLIECFAAVALRAIRPGAVAIIGLALLAPLVALHMPHTVPKRGPDVISLAYEEVQFQSADGMHLAGWLVPHPCARGNVIFCHGHGRNRGHAAPLLPTLHGLRLNVLAFDFRGHGDSDGHTARFGRHEVDDLLAAVAFLRARYPDHPLFVVGVSYGAAVALQALPRLPNVAGVWSEGSFARLDHVVANEFHVVPEAVRGGVVAAYDALAWLDCGIRGRDVRPIDSLAGGTVPVYFCHARGDELVPFAEGEALYDAYRGPKWCWWVDDATHYNIRQRHPDEYRRRLRAFVEDCLTRTAALSTTS